MNQAVNIFDFSQLQIKEIVISALMQHYGYVQGADGTWKDGGSARKMPVPLGALRIKRKDFFQVVYCGTKQQISFFDAAQDPAKPFNSNYKSAVLPDNKFYVFAGIKFQAAAGAAAGTDAIKALNFVTPTQNELLNGLVTFDLNNKKEFEKEPFREKFLNSDNIPDYFRLPQMKVLEPNEGMKFDLDLCDAFGGTTYVYAKAAILGFLLEQ